MPHKVLVVAPNESYAEAVTYQTTNRSDEELDEYSAKKISTVDTSIIINHDDALSRDLIILKPYKPVVTTFTTILCICFTGILIAGFVATIMILI